jgi:hypothetical protein
MAPNRACAIFLVAEDMSGLVPTELRVPLGVVLTLCMKNKLSSLNKYSVGDVCHALKNCYQACPYPIF